MAKRRDVPQTRDYTEYRLCQGPGSAGAYTLVRDTRFQFVPSLNSRIALVRPILTRSFSLIEAASNQTAA